MRLGFSAFAGLFVVTTLIAGASYWQLTSEEQWLVGYQSEQGFVPKFKLKWYEQLVVSGIVGMMYAAAVTAGSFVLYWLGTYINSKNSLPKS